MRTPIAVLHRVMTSAAAPRAALLIVLATSACSDAGTPAGTRPDNGSERPPGPPANISAGADTLRQGIAGSPLAHALMAIVRDSSGRRLEGISVDWRIVAGVGGLSTWDHPIDGPTTPPFVTPTLRDGGARIYFWPFSIGTSVVEATVLGDPSLRIAFRMEAGAILNALVHVSPIFDCGETSAFSSGPPDWSNKFVVEVGKAIVWSWEVSWAPDCVAQVRSVAVPPGGMTFESGVLRSGDTYAFVPNAPGVWTFEDAINGGIGSFTAVLPPP